MFEYKVIAAPARTAKVKGLKTTGDRFAHLMGEKLNAEADDGWEFLRAETLPCEERRGLTGWRKSFQTVLVFRRALAAGHSADMSFAEPASGQAAGAEGWDVGHDRADDAVRAPHEAPGHEPANDGAGAGEHRSHGAPDTASARLSATPAEAARERAGRLMAFGRPEPVLRPAPGMQPEGGGGGARPEPTLRSRRPGDDTDDH